MPTRSSTPKLFSTFAGLLGVFGICLYFTGWMYRLAYFAFFDIHLTNLSIFSKESFLIVPIQVVFDSLPNFIQFLLFAIVTSFLIWVSLFIFKWFCRYPLFHPLLSSLIRDMIIVLWILVSLFWWGTFQGLNNAYRDANNETTTLPYISLVNNTSSSVIGRFPRQEEGDGKNIITPIPLVFKCPSTSDNAVGKNNTVDEKTVCLADYTILGDFSRFTNMLDTERKLDFNPNKKPSSSWRLLLETDKFIYLIITNEKLKDKDKSNIFSSIFSIFFPVPSREHPFVVAVNVDNNKTQFSIRVHGEPVFKH